ncbi:MAG TPA: DNA translocase FtsK, partial [Candidatus Avoscillospira avicola]|nr:DNA translocase FtsK [Candidatus Avoscillospira avicola]
IHLVIATQRPSADVITGLMKANIPSRIAFAVASAMESRIILDTAGAEKLVGKGDMLYAPLGQGKPRRVQGCFITDDEVQSVVEFIKGNAAADYDAAVMQEIDQKAKESGGKSGSGGASAASLDDGESEGDELLPAAVDVILETGQASVSMLQRRLKLGYARAARIVDEMEEKGIVGPFEGSKPRQLLITKEQWQQMQGLTPEAPAADEPEAAEQPEDLPWDDRAAPPERPR